MSHLLSKPSMSLELTGKNINIEENPKKYIHWRHWQGIYPKICSSTGYPIGDPYWLYKDNQEIKWVLKNRITPEIQYVDFIFTVLHEHHQPDTHLKMDDCNSKSHGVKKLKISLINISAPNFIPHQVIFIREWYIWNIFTRKNKFPEFFWH